MHPEHGVGARSAAAQRRVQRRAHSARRSGGIALVAVTMAIALLSAVAVGVATTATTGDRLVSHALARSQAEALARSGVAAARAALVDASRVPDLPDTLAAPWLRPLDPQLLGSGVVRVQVEDEARRLDPNVLPDAVAPLFARLGVGAERADGLLDWIDADDVVRPHGAERRWYEAQRLPAAPPNRRLRAVADLLVIRGFDAATFERVRPFLGTAGEDGINPNTAPPDVMLAVWDPHRTGELIAARRRGPVECGDLPHCITRSTHYLIRATGTVGPTSQTIEARVRVLPGLDAEIEEWRVTERMARVPTQ
jgi:general secretion pathway protein K